MSESKERYDVFTLDPIVDRPGVIGVGNDWAPHVPFDDVLADHNENVLWELRYRSVTVNETPSFCQHPYPTKFQRLEL